MNITKHNFQIYNRQVNKHLNRRWYTRALTLIAKYRLPGYCITQTRAKTEFKLTDKQLSKFKFIEAKNPHYSSAPPMKLYLLKQIIDTITRTEKTKKQ